MLKFKLRERYQAAVVTSRHEATDPISADIRVAALLCLVQFFQPIPETS